LHKLGWVVGMVGASQGADLLLARREALGLCWSLEALAELLAREQRRLELPERLPRVRPEENEAQVCWELLLWIRGWALAPRQRLSLHREAGAWVVRLEGVAAELRLPPSRLVELP